MAVWLGIAALWMVCVEVLMSKARGAESGKILCLDSRV